MILGVGGGGSHTGLMRRGILRAGLKNQDGVDLRISNTSKHIEYIYAKRVTKSPIKPELPSDT